MAASAGVGTKSCGWIRQMPLSERRVCQVLEDPARREQEYRQRLQPHQQRSEYEGLETQMGKLRRGIARLIDSSAEGLIDKQEFEPRGRRLRERMQRLEDP